MIMIFWLFLVFFCALVWVFLGFLYTAHTKETDAIIKWYEYIIMGGMLALIFALERAFEDDLK